MAIAVGEVVAAEGDHGDEREAGGNGPRSRDRRDPEQAGRLDRVQHRGHRPAHPVDQQPTARGAAQQHRPRYDAGDEAPPRVRAGEPDGDGERQRRGDDECDRGGAGRTQEAAERERRGSVVTVGAERAGRARTCDQRCVAPAAQRAQDVARGRVHAREPAPREQHDERHSCVEERRGQRDRREPLPDREQDHLPDPDPCGGAAPRRHRGRVGAPHQRLAQHRADGLFHRDVEHERQRVAEGLQRERHSGQQPDVVARARRADREPGVDHVLLDAIEDRVQPGAKAGERPGVPGELPVDAVEHECDLQQDRAGHETPTLARRKGAGGEDGDQHRQHGHGIGDQPWRAAQRATYRE